MNEGVNLVPANILNTTLSLTNKEQVVVCAIVKCATGLIPMQGYSLIMNNHHCCWDLVAEGVCCHREGLLEEHRCDRIVQRRYHSHPGCFVVQCMPSGHDESQADGRCYGRYYKREVLRCWHIYVQTPCPRDRAKGGGELHHALVHNQPHIRVV